MKVLKEIIHQKFLWLTFNSFAGLCCSGRPTAVAQEELFIKLNKQALIPMTAITQALSFVDPMSN